MCAKFKGDPLSRFRTGACQVFTAQKLFPSEIPLKLQNCNIKFPLNTFPDQITWNVVTALSQLKLSVYSYFPYDNANLPYAVAVT